MDWPGSSIQSSELIHNSGRISPTATGEFDIQVTVTNATLGINETANGKVKVEETLSATSNLTAKLIATGNCPGFARISEVPNILFFPDGFLAADEAKFNSILDNYIQSLMTGNMCQNK